MSLSDFIFGKNPSKKAMPYLEKAEGMAQEQYNPYQQQGQRAYENLQPQYERMTQDPTGFIDQLMKSYSPSEGFKFQEDYLRRGMKNTAAAGGFSGTPYDQLEQTRAVQGLLGTDMQNYLSNSMNAFGAGMQGQRDFYNTGYDATKNLSDSLGNLYGSQATLEFKGQEQRNKNRTDMLKSILQLLSSGGMGAMESGDLEGAVKSILASGA